MNDREAKIKALQMAWDYLLADINSGAVYEVFQDIENAEKVVKHLEKIVANLRYRAEKLENK